MCLRCVEMTKRAVLRQFISIHLCMFCLDLLAMFEDYESLVSNHGKNSEGHESRT